MMDHRCDIAIIGGGSGGLSVAAGAAQLGMKVVLFEKGEMGGDCLNTGCVPSKALLSNGKKTGDFKQAHDHVKNVIATIAPHDSQERFESLGVTVLRSKASFINSHTLITDDGDNVKAQFIVIATGSHPVIPPIPGLNGAKNVLTNETIFDLQEKPKNLTIIGGGPIGVEMAQAHADLGCKVSLIDMGTILIKDDPDLVAVVRDSLIKRGITLYEHANIEKIEDNKVILTDGVQINASHILIAAGRRPNTDGLGLDKVGIEINRQGIVTDKRLRTTQKHIFAIGDVAGGPQFTHVAGYHAGIIIKNICFRIPTKIDYTALPWVTYTDPELAQIGMTEAMAINRYGMDNIRVMTQPFSGNDRALAEDKTDGLIKIIGLKNGKILGVGIAGEKAGEMVSFWALPIQKGLKFSAIAGLILPYPSRSEIHKRAAGSWYTDSLFSDKTRKIVRFLQKLPWF